jgi:uncharacterized membrane protein
MTDTNQRAMNDYLRRLRWALAPLPSRDREEIVTELRGHFVERIEAGGTDFEAVAAEFGTPEEYAHSFLDNYRISTALASGSTRSMAGAALGAMGRSLGAFFGSLGVFILFAFAFAFALIAVFKPFAPHQVGLWTAPGEMVLGITDRNTALYTDQLGYWIIPLALLGAGLIYLLARSSLRAFLRAMRK